MYGVCIYKTKKDLVWSRYKFILFQLVCGFCFIVDCNTVKTFSETILFCNFMFSVCFLILFIFFVLRFSQVGCTTKNAFIVFVFQLFSLFGMNSMHFEPFQFSQFLEIKWKKIFSCVRSLLTMPTVIDCLVLAARKMERTREIREQNNTIKTDFLLHARHIQNTSFIFARQQNVKNFVRFQCRFG